MGDILFAYSAIGEHEIFEVFEQEILSSKLGKTPDEIYSTLLAFAHCSMGSAQLYEYFDKIIGKNVNIVQDD
jgi:hypothetical protein